MKIINKRTLLFSPFVNEQDVQRAMLLKVRKDRCDETIMNRKLGDGFNLEDLLDEVACHYIRKAWGQLKGNGSKKKVSQMLGFKNHQTFSNWTKRLNIPEEER